MTLGREGSAGRPGLDVGEAPLRLQTTRDEIARGKLVILQPRGGYRFNVDSVILAGFASPPGRRVCDLGTGSGVVGLWLAEEGAKEVQGVEIQPELAELARRNALENRLEDHFFVVERDLRHLDLAEGEAPFDQVVSNPPFSPAGRGRVDSDPQRAVARHEISMKLEDLFVAARRLLHGGGRFDLIHRADREAELLEAARRNGLRPVRLRRVVPRSGRPPSRVLLETRPVTRRSRPQCSSDTGGERDSDTDHGGEGHRTRPSALVIEEPLIVHDEDGRYSPELACLLGDQGSPAK